MSQAEQIYQDWIEALPVQQQLELVAKITQRLTQLLKENVTPTIRPHSIMELHGLGAKQWTGIDAQSYVDTLRNEWNWRLKIFPRMCPNSNLSSSRF